MRFTHKHLGIPEKECNCKKWFNARPSINWPRLLASYVRGLFRRFVLREPYAF